jgi:hypothetical protein
VQQANKDKAALAKQIDAATKQMGIEIRALRRIQDRQLQADVGDGDTPQTTAFSQSAGKPYRKAAQKTCSWLACSLLGRAFLTT